MPEATPIVPQPFFGEIVRRFVLLLFRLLGGLTILDAQNVPKVGPVLICPNHLSDCDPLAVYAALPRRDVYFVAKHELFQIPVLGTGLVAFGTIPIHRETADRTAIRRAVAVLVQGSVLVVFPEGHLSQSGTLQRLLPGAGMIALQAQTEIARKGSRPLTIVPVGLTRTNWFLPYAAPFLKRSRLPARLIFGKPIHIDSTGGARQNEQLIVAIEQEMRRLTNQ